MFSGPPIINLQPSLYHEADIDIFAQKMFTRTHLHKEALIYLVHEGLTKIQASDRSRVLNQGPAL